MLPAPGRGALPAGCPSVAPSLGGDCAAEPSPASKPKPVALADEDYQPLSVGSSDNESNNESPLGDRGPRLGKRKKPSSGWAPEVAQKGTKCSVSSNSLAALIDSGRPKKPARPGAPPTALLAAAYIPLSGDAAPPVEDGGAAEAYRRRVRALQSADHRTEAPVRITIRKRLAEALQAHGSGKHPGEVHAEIIAAEVEEALFTTSGSIVNDGYKQKFRRLEFNIKDPKNGALRHSVLCAHTTARQLVSMKPDELANPALKEEYRKIAEYKAQEKLADSENRVTSDAWKCGKCGARRCTYTEIQVRRADEPMTTFVQCTVCNNRWRC